MGSRERESRNRNIIISPEVSLFQKLLCFAAILPITDNVSIYVKGRTRTRPIKWEGKGNKRKEGGGMEELER